MTVQDFDFKGYKALSGVVLCMISVQLSRTRKANDRQVLTQVAEGVLEEIPSVSVYTSIYTPVYQCF